VLDSQRFGCGWLSPAAKPGNKKIRPAPVA
jgi:hypothetical protein